MAVRVITAHPGYTFAYTVKAEQLEEKALLLKEEMSQFVRRILDTGYPELKDKPVTATFDNGALTFHVNEPDQDVATPSPSLEEVTS